MAQKTLKQMLGLEEVNPWLGLKIPEEMLVQQSGPFARLLNNNYGDRAATPSREPASSPVPVQIDTNLDTAAPAPTEAMYQDDDLTALENSPEWLARVPAQETAVNTLVTPDEAVISGEMAPGLTTQDAEILSKKNNDENPINKYAEKLANANRTPWLSLIDSFAGTKLAEGEKDRNKGDNEYLKLAHKSEQQQERFDFYNGRDLTNKLSKVVEDYSKAKTAMQDVADALAIKETSGKVSLPRVNAVLGKLLKANDVVGAQTEKDISRQLSPTIQMMIAAIKGFFGGNPNEDAVISPEQVQALVEQVNTAALLAGQKAKDRVDYYTKAYVGQGLTPAEAEKRAKAANDFLNEKPITAISKEGKTLLLDEERYKEGTVVETPPVKSSPKKAPAKKKTIDDIYNE